MRIGGGAIVKFRIMRKYYMGKDSKEIYKKPIIMQHNTTSFIDNGGPATGVKLIMESHLKNKYQFIQLLEKGGNKISVIKNMVTQIKKVKPDLIHVRGLQSSGFYGLLAARLAGCKKVIVSVHGMSIDTAIGFSKKLFYKKIIEPCTLKNADLVFCVCNYAAQRPYIIKNAKNLYGYIHNAAPDYSSYDHEKVRLSKRKELEILPDEIIITSVGRIVIDKGIQHLVKSIKLIDKKLKVRFLIVGEGPFLPDLKFILSEEIQSGRVIVLGKRSDVSNILFASDIFVFPTLRENLSNALLEASAAGLAIIATNVGGNSEVISNNYTGILIPPADSMELSKKIVFLATNQEKREELGANAKKNVEINFNQRIIFNQYDEVYSQVLNS